MANKNAFDLGGLVNNLKSMVNPGAGTPDADPQDVLGVQLADLSKLVQEVKARHDQYAKTMSKDLAKINQLFNGIHGSLKAISEGGVEPDAPAQPAAEAPAPEPEIIEEPVVAEEPAEEAPKEDNQDDK